MKKSEILTKNDLLENLKNQDVYRNLLNELKSILSKGQARAYKAVDNIKVQTYWQIGERIVRNEIENKERADYGHFLIKKIATDLSIDQKELYKIVKFFRLYENVVTLSRQLSWNHYVELIRIENHIERSFYQTKTVNENWSVRELRSQIRNGLFNNSISNNETLPVRKRQSISNALEIFKAEYDLGFAGTYQNEEELENGIVAKYALCGLEEKIFIATYQPKLPTIEQLKKAMKKVKE
ncbi:MAG TPA: DUF1016 N-terminal domain-containing protein [bacterium]|nr:DUF1016 N-terminal domain-containing protein [bacterium]